MAGFARYSTSRNGPASLSFYLMVEGNLLDPNHTEEQGKVVHNFGAFSKFSKPLTLCCSTLNVETGAVLRYCFTAGDGSILAFTQHKDAADKLTSPKYSRALGGYPATLSEKRALLLGYGPMDLSNGNVLCR